MYVDYALRKKKSTPSPHPLPLKNISFCGSLWPWTFLIVVSTEVFQILHGTVWKENSIFLTGSSLENLEQKLCPQIRARTDPQALEVWSHRTSFEIIQREIRVTCFFCVLSLFLSKTESSFLPSDPTPAPSWCSLLGVPVPLPLPLLGVWSPSELSCQEQWLSTPEPTPFWGLATQEPNSSAATLFLESH